MQHFIIDANLQAPFIQISDKEILHQMKQVLRFKIGEKIILMDGKGLKASGQIIELHKKMSTIQIESLIECPLPQNELRLFIALPKKPSTLELIVQKASELGVTEIIPLKTERTQISELRKTDRILAIIKEACEQSERAYAPALRNLINLENISTNGILLVGDARIFDSQLSKVKIPKNEAVNLFIGPEGGFSEKELQNLKEKGAFIFKLGEEILRMETAVIASLAIIKFANN